MRRPRLLAPPHLPEAFYHVISRVVDRQYALASPALKQVFRDLLRELAAFCDIQILSFCLMDNHFHLFLRVPRPPETPPSPQQTLLALRHLSSTSAATQRHQGEQLLEAGDPSRLHAWASRINARRFRLAPFVKELKQRFSCHYNRLHQRRGTLWEERFKSLLVEGSGDAMATVAAYIDLNPVRAGRVRDPKDYRWSSYGEAVAGVPEACEGLQRIVNALQRGSPPASSTDLLAEYRQHLFRQGDEWREGVGEDGRPLRGSLSHDEVLKVLQNKGRLPAADYLRVRVRYLCDGTALGSREFIDQLFHTHRSRFGTRRTTGARLLRGLEGKPLYTLRALRVRVFG